MSKNEHIPKMSRRTKAFADKILNEPHLSNASAYIATHETNNRKAASVEATRLLKRPAVIIYLKKHEELAKQTLVEAVKDSDAKWSDRIRAAQDILDRNLGKATIKTESENRNINLNVETRIELGSDFAAFLLSKTEQK